MVKPLFLSKEKLKNRLKELTCFLFGIMLIFVGGNFVRFLISETDSLPQHYFVHLPKVKPHKNDYILLYSQWYQRDIIKQILGVAGDEIWYDRNHYLWVNDQKIGLIKQKSTDGRPLTAIKAQIIPKDFVFVYSNHEFSFDSRYQELGLIPLSSIRGKVIPLW